MDVRRSGSVDSTEVVDGVHNAALLTGERTNLLEFRIEPGATVPEHSHPHEQIGYVVRGTATFVVAGDERVLEAGDTYLIPGDEPHSLENRGAEPVVGVDVFGPPRDDAPFARD